jgi:post-segregation antitoxin (ccd killing protein)
MDTDVLSLRVNKQLKAQALKLGIDLRKVLEEAIKTKIENSTENQLRQDIEHVKTDMKGVSYDEWTKLVRKTRDSL